MTGIHQDVIAHLRAELVQQRNIAAATTRRIGEMQSDLRELADSLSTSHAKSASLRELLRTADPDHAGEYADPQPGPDLAERDAILVGLREMLDWLQMHPAIPVRGLADQTVFPHRRSTAEDEAAVASFAAEMGVEAKRYGPSSHYEGVKRFGPKGVVELSACSTTGTPAHWTLGDPMPTGVPAVVVARYAAKWHAAHPDQGTCPYAGSCDSCFRNDEPVPVPGFSLEELPDEPPGAEAKQAQQLLDAEQADAAGTLPPTPPCGCEAGESCPDCVPSAEDDTEAERALDAYVAAYPTDGEDGGA